ncbi:MAG: ABC transporter permease subunit, partial [Thermoproteota archaeon]
VKEEGYIEAATSYGASDLRIVLFYLWPRILPTIIPGLIGAVPGYIFLEAGLAFLGLGEPTLPTWGKMLNDAYNLGAVYQGYWWWILLPIALIFGIAIAFATIGYSLEKILNPRLREE